MTRRVSLSLPSSYDAVLDADRAEPVARDSCALPPSPTPAAAPAASAIRVPPVPEQRVALAVAVEDETQGFWRAWRVPSPANPGWSRARCPRCTHSEDVHAVLPETILVHHEGRFYCARCGHHGDARISPDRYRGSPALESLLATTAPTGLTLEGVWNSWGLDGEALVTHLPQAHLGQAFFEQDDEGTWAPAVLLPVYAEEGGALVDVVQLQLAASTGALLGEQRAANGQRWPWGWQRLTQDRVVMVDHPIDALALLAAGEMDVVALPSTMNPVRAGGGDWSTLALIEHGMQSMSEIVIAFRDDEVSHRFEEELGRRLGRERCLRVRWQHHRPPQGLPSAASVSQHFGPVGLKEAVSLATPFPVAGVHELMDVDERFELLYEFGLQPGVSTGWPTLDTHYTIKAGQWTVVTGIPGHGKSNFLDSLVVNLAQLHGWRFGVFSPENQPIERHFANLMEKAAGAPFNEGRVPRISVEQKNQLKGFLNDHFKIILPDEEYETQSQWTIEGVLELARVLVYRYGIRGLIIDPWNELDHQRPNSTTETEYISGALTKIRRFARLYSVHVWVVAHPTKLEPRADGQYPVPTPYMISGGANWRNKADNALSIFRNVGKEDQDITDVHVQKIRFKEVGMVGLVSLRHDITCGRYYDDLDQLKRSEALNKGLIRPSREIRVPMREVNPQALDYYGDDEDPLRSPYD